MIARDAGRARQGRAGAPDVPARREGSATSCAPTTRTRSRWFRWRCCRRSMSLRELTSLTDQTIVKGLENVPGVARIDVNGKVTRQILVQIKPDALTALGIGVDQVMNAIRAANQDVPAGRLSRGQSDAIVRIEGKIREPAQFGRIIVAQQGGGPGLPVAGRRRDRRREGGDVDRAHQRPTGDHDRHPQGAGRQHRRDRARARARAVDALTQAPAQGRRAARSCSTRRTRSRRASTA